MKRFPLFLAPLFVLLLFADSAKPATGHPRVTLYTDFGDIVIELYPDKAPKSVANFQKLVGVGYYQNLTFHRVVPGFVIQGGDPLGTGEGGPGYTIPAEITPDLTHEEGIVAWAREGDDTNPQRRSSGSQFYITSAPVHRLDGKYTIFGKVVDGMDAVHKIENVPRSLMDRPLDPPRMHTLRKPEHPSLDFAMITQRCGDLSVTPYFDEGHKKFEWHVLRNGETQYTLYSADLSAEYNPDEPYKFFPKLQAWMYCEPLRQRTRLDPVVDIVENWEKRPETGATTTTTQIYDYVGEKVSPIVSLPRLYSPSDFLDPDGDGVKVLVTWDDRLIALKDDWLTIPLKFPLLVCWDATARRYADCTAADHSLLDDLFEKDRGDYSSEFERGVAVRKYAWSVMTGQKDAALKTLGAACDADCQNWLKAHDTQIEQLVKTPRKLQ